MDIALGYSADMEIPYTRPNNEFNNKNFEKTWKTLIELKASRGRFIFLPPMKDLGRGLEGGVLQRFSKEPARRQVVPSLRQVKSPRLQC